MSKQQAFDTLLRQGYEQLEEGRYEEAVEIFSACSVLNSNDDRIFRGRALALIKLDKAKDAALDFYKAKSLNGNDPENWSGLALSLTLQNQIYSALKIYEEILEKFPDYVNGYIQIGFLQFKVGAISKGKDYFKKALTLKPNLNQRRVIEATLREQTKEDKNRYYRPDFERLRQQGQGFSFKGLWKDLVDVFKKKLRTGSISVHHPQNL